MKVFIISALIFALLLSAIGLNAYAVKRVCKNILIQIELIEAEEFSKPAIDALEEYWGNNKIFLGFSASRTEIDHISKTIVSLQAVCDSDTLTDAKLYLSLLKNSVSDLAEREDISLENLF